VDERVGDAFPEGDEWVDRPVDHRSIGEGSDVGVEIGSRPCHGLIENPGNRPGEELRVACAGAVASARFCGDLYGEAVVPLLRMDAECQNPCGGRRAVTVENSRAAQELQAYTKLSPKVTALRDRLARLVASYRRRRFWGSGRLRRRTASTPIGPRSVRRST
jgi:hypothetical protein